LVEFYKSEKTVPEEFSLLLQNIYPWGNFVFTPNLILFLLTTPQQISAPYDNSFWEKSNPAEERKRKNAINSGQLVQLQRMQAARAKNMPLVGATTICPLPKRQCTHSARSKNNFPANVDIGKENPRVRDVSRNIFIIGYCFVKDYCQFMGVLSLTKVQFK
jgi:hypothetical protein